MEKIYERCILICAGDLTVSSIPLKDKDLVIAVDGGLMYCEVLGVEPDLILGDFDSIDDSFAEKVKVLEASAPEKIIRLNPMKDDTDTLAAIRIGLEKGCEEFHFYGAMGGRVEHTIANFQCLHFLKNQGKACYIWDGAAMVTLIQNESISFQEHMEGLLSVFAFGKAAKGVFEKGLKYELTDAVIETSFPIGISNEFIGKKAEIGVEQGSLLVIVRWE